jgi:hypothetical protein
VVLGERLLKASLPSLRAVVEGLNPGEYVACSIPLNGSPIRRLWTYGTLPLQRWWAERVFGSAGADVVGRWGVDPDIDAPACMFDLDSDAEVYAGERLRPRGSQLALRRALARVFGVDPALGAIVIVGRKR